ncbi:MAG: PVC-type heme-binding CxxCH protein [Mariniblastus sp.]
MNRFFSTTHFTHFAVVIVFLVAPAISLAQDSDIHQSQNAIGQFDIHPELDVELFAAEPFLANPSNIDVDHLGRIWVCEVLNYRHFRNTDAKPREAGDRILIIEDTDGDAIADKKTVFYQGRDIDSAHGICVLGDRAIVSANDSVFFLIDTDGDSKADKKEILFTGISGSQHDHGIHAFVFGPDGKLYFNFGNAGKQIKDKNGNQIVDMAGNKVTDENKPYNQGMIFRCNMDGSEFETLAWNFRNNWEMCIDSFGSIWQSDNDDDGNRATRINYVMPFGNYGFTDQKTGSNWRTQRTGMHADIPLRHWHLNDPGVIPNLLQTGAGSPTGICVYEGDALPEVFRNQVIHCDAGPSIVRAYPVKKKGAGYTAEIVNVMDGAKKNQWFRPSDVCVAPDGSLIVADWYDPGVGGHRMQDTERGRLFRVSKKGSDRGKGIYKIPTVDFSTPELAADALCSPNHETRFLAWTALKKFGAESIPALKILWADKNPRIRARALWLIGKLDVPKSDKLPTIQSALTDANPDLRVAAIRLCVQLRDQLDVADISGQINPADPAPEFRRALLIGLRQWRGDHFPQLWTMLANQYEPGDRWYLEALGIAADGHWDDCLNEWMGGDELKLTSSAGRDIVWRSRGEMTPELIAKIIRHEKTNAEQTTRYFRAFDFLTSKKRTDVLASLAFDQDGFDKEKSMYVLMESAGRLNAEELSDNQKVKVSELIDSNRGTPMFVKFVGKFSSKEHYPELLKIVTETKDRQLAADAMGVLMDKNQAGMVHGMIVNQPEMRESVCDALVNCGRRVADYTLSGVAKREGIDTEARTYAIQRLGETRSGAGDMLWWIDQEKQGKGKIAPVIMPAIKAALHRARWPEVRAKATELFPIAATKDNRSLPPMNKLAELTGDVANGKVIFDGVGTCAKCHIVAGKGIEVGPDLSEIGSKLTKQAMYESILFPSAGISHNYENWAVIKDDGQMITGVLLGETDAEIQIKDEKGIKHTIPMESVDEKRRQKLSLMPADLHKEMSTQELVDLVEYLVGLKKQEK